MGCSIGVLSAKGVYSPFPYLLADAILCLYVRGPVTHWYQSGVTNTRNSKIERGSSEVRESLSAVVLLQACRTLANTESKKLIPQLTELRCVSKLQYAFIKALHRIECYAGAICHGMGGRCVGCRVVVTPILSTTKCSRIEPWGPEVSIGRQWGPCRGIGLGLVEDGYHTFLGGARHPS